MLGRKPRILIGKPGLDGHDRGAKIIANAFRDDGYEVIYTGRRNTPEQIVNTAIQESVDVIGLSILSGAHKTICSRIIRLLKEKNMSDMPVIVGGIIPNDDISVLKQLGISMVFGPGTSLPEIVQAVRRKIFELRD